MASPIILIANPGSASRKYALYKGEYEQAGLHFEWENGKVICTLRRDGEQHTISTGISDITQAASQLTTVLKDNDLLQDTEHIEKIGLRIVAPSSYFLKDHLVDNDFVKRLKDLEPRAPLHIAATLDELRILRDQFSNAVVVGVSDSAFHASKPDYAWNYGISLEDADMFEIKRFGYHGLSAASVVHQLKVIPSKLIVCHLGSGASVTAILDGKSVDNSMGYSPLEGIIMSTRSGSIDPTAIHALKDARGFDDTAMEDYLNNRSGLLGLGGSSDIRELLRREIDGDNQSRLALATYAYSVQKAIAQMTAALGGIDALVLTGTVGERSTPMRERIVEQLSYINLVLDKHNNSNCQAPKEITKISPADSKPIFVIPTQESAEIARRVITQTDTQ